ncbi:S41 family peptidase [Polyangium sp. 6x1]|uniref:S41 family peptidase n=1 Tax=Polyangium sp. 6x1 TaxID=3042689 RepID=UPI002482CA39|nr:S41 family peptidase [Polyangium sp. 6x1]MDI1450276.1 S41 family peptidase [Polyangium sp. 6x1]
MTTVRMRFLASLSALLLQGCGSAGPETPVTPPGAPDAAPVHGADVHAVAAKPAPAKVDVVSEEERAREKARWESLGLRVTGDGPVLPDPFAEPFSRRSFVVPSSWFEGGVERSKGTATVEASAVLADLDVLEKAMRIAYGGWDSAAKRGWDWDGWFARWREQLKAQGEKAITVRDAFLPMKDLMAAQLDNHTTVPLGLRFGSGSRSAVLARAPSSSCDRARTESGDEVAVDPADKAQQPRAAFQPDARGAALRPVHYIAYPASRGEYRSIHCGTEWIDVTSAFHGPAPTLALAKIAEDQPSARRVSPEIVAIRLPTFTKRNAERLDAALPSFPERSSKDRVLLVDLRDNDGGDAAFQALERWIPFPTLEPHMGLRKRVGASCVYHGLRFGYTSMTSMGLTPPIRESMRSRLQAILDEEASADQGGPCKRAFEDVGDKKTYRAQPFEPNKAASALRVLVLVNHACGSDCEYMVTVLRSLPGTVVAGTNTFGVGQFIQPGYSVLPRTRLPFRIALGMSDMYGDGRSFDGYGLDVDVLLPTEALHQPDAIIDLAKRLARAR